MEATYTAVETATSTVVTVVEVEVTNVVIGVATKWISQLFHYLSSYWLVVVVDVCVVVWVIPTADSKQEQAWEIDAGFWFFTHLSVVGVGLGGLVFPWGLKIGAGKVVVVVNESVAVSVWTVQIVFVNICVNILTGWLASTKIVWSILSYFVCWITAVVVGSMSPM